jgi:hypothetical protein
MAAKQLTTADLELMHDEEDWAGHGYLFERSYHDPEEVAAADYMVLTFANEVGITYEELFEWANSKAGRWFGDCVFSGGSKYDAAMYLPRSGRPMPETTSDLELTPTPAPAEPVQTFEVTYLAPATGTQRVETVEATTVHTVPVAPRDAEVLLSIYLVTKQTALHALTAAAAEARTKRETAELPTGSLIERAAREDARRLAERREGLARLRARKMGATVDETYAATIAGIRQVSPSF